MGKRTLYKSEGLTRNPCNSCKIGTHRLNILLETGGSSKATEPASLTHAVKTTETLFQDGLWRTEVALEPLHTSRDMIAPTATHMDTQKAEGGGQTPVRQSGEPHKMTTPAA